MCLFPRSIRVTLKDGNCVSMNVPCGKCIDCLSTRVSDWVYRLKIENQHCEHAAFVTLTYDDTFLPSKGVDVSHLQKHFKRIRKRLNSFRYYGIGEYGTKTNRPHYHYLMFTDDNVTLSQLRTIISECWNFGFNVVKSVTTGRIVYVISYLKAQHCPDGKNKPFCVMSKRPAIGYQVLEDPFFCQTLKDRDFQYLISKGHKIHVPRYYKKKLCDKDFTFIDYIKLKCICCQREYVNKMEYAKTHTIRNLKEFLFNIGNTRNTDLVEYGLYVHAENVNKDYVMKQRNKKTRLL